MTTIVRDIFVFVTAAIFVAAACAHYDRGRRARIQGRRPRHRSSLVAPDPERRQHCGRLSHHHQQGKDRGSPDRRRFARGGPDRGARGGRCRRHDEDAPARERHRDQARQDRGAQARLASYRAARPQGAIPARPEDQGHAGVREGRAGRDRLQRRGKSRRRRQWRRWCSSTSTIRVRLRRASAAGLVSNASFSSRDPDQCPARTKSSAVTAASLQPSPQRRRVAWPFAATMLCASLLGIGLAYLRPYAAARMGA